jgi:hypothetical protein
MKVKVTIEWDYTWGTPSADATKMSEEESWEHAQKLKGETPVSGTFRVEFTP